MVCPVCEKCGSCDLTIMQTNKMVSVTIICRNCGHEKILDETLYNELIKIYDKHVCERVLREIREEQGNVGEYI